MVSMHGNMTERRGKEASKRILTSRKKKEK